ncbi:MAG: hypothetical protein IKW86_10045 [Salinivirgaceae bacterium]|nr:hypothetical protein [Salinivirgaceae bacterium]
MYSLDYKVTVSMCDADGRLKLFSALQMMQDCSELWKTSEPVYDQYFTENGMAQLLASRQVEVVRVPQYKENLKVTTSVFDINPMFGFRNTFIYDANGLPCYKSWSTGAFVKLDTGKLNKISDELVSSFNREPKLEMNYADRRIIVPKINPTSTVSYVVQRNDIDYNRHMNNANYIRLSLETLPDDFEVRNMRVEFKKTAKLSDELILEVVNQSDDTIFVVEKLAEQISTIIELKK